MTPRVRSSSQLRVLFACVLSLSATTFGCTEDKAGSMMAPVQMPVAGAIGEAGMGGAGAAAGAQAGIGGGAEVTGGMSGGIGMAGMIGMAGSAGGQTGGAGGAIAAGTGGDGGAIAGAGGAGGADAGGTGGMGGMGGGGAGGGDTGSLPCAGDTPHGCFVAQSGNHPMCPPNTPEQSAFYPPADQWNGCNGIEPAAPFGGDPEASCSYTGPAGEIATCLCDTGLHWLCTYPQ